MLPMENDISKGCHRCERGPQSATRQKKPGEVIKFFRSGRRRLSPTSGYWEGVSQRRFSGTQGKKLDTQRKGGANVTKEKQVVAL